MNNLELLKTDVRKKVFDFEDWSKQQPQIELEVKHYFSYGIYARELHIPAGVILTGHVHKLENLNILSKGRMKLVSEFGMRELEAPFTVVSPPGTKRIALAITDCVWTTIHGTFEKDLNIIEQTFIAKTEQEYLEYCGQPKAIRDLFEGLT